MSCHIKYGCLSQCHNLLSSVNIHSLQNFGLEHPRKINLKYDKVKLLKYFKPRHVMHQKLRVVVGFRD